MPPTKESSDRLDAPFVEPAHIVIPARRRSLADYAALALATCGVGLIPLAPGTWGSAVGVGLYLLWRAGSRSLDAAGPHGLAAWRTTSVLLMILVIGLAGIWAATRAEKLLGRKDPGAVVVDEVAGQLIALLALPWDARWPLVLAAFVAFRLFDMWKPYPVRRLESLASGLGIMADDVLAGAYAAVLVSVLVSLNAWL